MASPVSAGSRASYQADVDLVTRAVIASTLIGSAVIHGTVAGEHFGEWMLAGIFFVALQVVELGLALLAVYAWGRRGAIVVIVTGLMTVSIWVVSRTVGMPFGPADFRVPEPVGDPDLACGVLELMSVVAAVVALVVLARPARTRPGSRPHTTRRGAVIAGALVWAAVVLTVWGGAPTVLATNTDHHHGAGAASSPP